LRGGGGGGGGGAGGGGGRGGWSEEAGEKCLSIIETLKQITLTTKGETGKTVLTKGSKSRVPVVAGGGNESMKYQHTKREALSGIYGREEKWSVEGKGTHSEFSRRAARRKNNKNTKKKKKKRRPKEKRKHQKKKKKKNKKKKKHRKKQKKKKKNPKKKPKKRLSIKGSEMTDSERQAIQFYPPDW